MPKAMKEGLQNGFSFDEPDRIPDNIDVSILDITMYVVAIVGHFVDLGLDLNVAIQYFLARRMMEFAWTLVFIFLPALVNTAVSVRMYTQDKAHQESISVQVTRRKVLRIFILVLQMAPILRFADALMYAIKSRRAGRAGKAAEQRKNYILMVKEDADAALLRIFECFLEAAPQQTLQMTLLFMHRDLFTVHQCLSIGSSLVGAAWCLAAYQRAVRFAQAHKRNVPWAGSAAQLLWHLLVTLSRISAISMVMYVSALWGGVACLVHILVMTTWLQLYDRSPFCGQSSIAQLGFSLSLGAVYLFTYILPVEGRTRYRYAIFYTTCLFENVTCALLWYFYAQNITDSVYFLPALVLSVVPYVVGLTFMVVYYKCLHPRNRKDGQDFDVTMKITDDVSS